MRSLLLLPALFFLTGCIDMSSPTKVVESVGYTIVKNKYKSYRKLLVGNARGRLGSKAAFNELRMHTDKFKSSQVGTEILLGKKQQSKYEVHSVYTVPVWAEDSILALAFVRCVENFGFNPIYPEDIKDWQVIGGGSETTNPGTVLRAVDNRGPIDRIEPSQPQWYETCQVSGFDVFGITLDLP